MSFRALASQSLCLCRRPHGFRNGCGRLHSLAFIEHVRITDAFTASHRPESSRGRMCDVHFTERRYSRFDAHNSIIMMFCGWDHGCYARSKEFSEQSRTFLTLGCHRSITSTASCRHLPQQGGAGGPDNPGAQRYVGGPALDAGRSCVTLCAMSRRVHRRARGDAGRSCVTPRP